MNITIIGDGAMATVSAILLTDNGHSVRLWGAFPDAIKELTRDRENRKYLPGARIPDSVHLTSDDADAFDSTELVVSAVPTQFIRNVWQRLATYCPANTPLVSVAKGVENGTLLRPTQVLQDVLTGSPQGNCPIAALSGPSIAGEIVRRLPTTVALASTDAALAQQVQKLFTTPYFRVYTNPDLVGVELGGAVKNVVAIAAGILDGLGVGDNAKAGLLTRGLVEITRLGVALGARRETFAGLAGLGDLVTTCVSPEGRNRRFGQEIGQGKHRDEVLRGMHSVVEGVATTVSVVELARKVNADMPITYGVHAVLFEGKSPREAIVELMARRPKGEDAEWV